MHLGNSTTPPTFKDLEKFLSAKVSNLKNLEDASNTRFAQPYTGAKCNSHVNQNQDRALKEASSFQVVRGSDASLQQSTNQK